MRRVLRFFRADTVSARLLGAFVLVSIVPVAVAGVLVYREGEQTLREELWQRLATVTQLRMQQIHSWLDGRRQDVVLPHRLSGVQAECRPGGGHTAAGPVAGRRGPHGAGADAGVRRVHRDVPARHERGRRHGVRPTPSRKARSRRIARTSARRPPARSSSTSTTRSRSAAPSWPSPRRSWALATSPSRSSSDAPTFGSSTT